MTPPLPTSPPDSWLPEEWDSASAAFDAVYALPEESRGAAVEALPDGPAKRWVQDLLATADRTGPLVPQARSVRDRLPEGTALGRFVVRRLAGEGGMGAVYAAEDPATEQWAAVKVLTSTAGDALQRFYLEQRLLARFDHEAIPKLLSAGTAPDGRPYFAMEYVEGAPITTFARSRSLGTLRRLELFARLCDAVRYVHRRGVVHRDLKASNVFASEEPGGRLRVHLLDLGVSKVLADTDRGPSWGGGLTGAGIAPLTPAYAAPEQRGTRDDTDRATTSTDVFALGLLLYELLTGRHADDADADAPSVMTDLGVGWAAARAIDAVVGRAIDPDPDRRYASADDLLDDVQRVLTGRAPAGAGAGLASAALWLAGKRVGLATAAAAVLSVLLAFTLADRRWRAAADASSAAERQAVGVLGDIVRTGPPPGPAGRTFLVGAGAAIRDGLPDVPEAEGDLSLAVADQLAARGACDEAAPLYGRAALLRETTAPDHPVVIAAFRGQARCAAGTPGTASASRTRRAVEFAERALALAATRYGAQSAVAAAVGTDLALYHALYGDVALAWDLLTEVEASLGAAAADARGESDRLREVREQAGAFGVVFPDAEAEGGVALLSARADVVAAVALTAQGSYGPAAERAGRAVAPLLSFGGVSPDEALGGAPGWTHRSGAWAEVVGFGLSTEAEALRRAGDGVSALAAADRAASTLATQFGEGDPRTVRARASSVALAAAGSTDPAASALFSAVVHDAEESGDAGLLGAVLQAQGSSLLLEGRTAAARAALERAVTVVRGAEPRTSVMAYAALADLDREVGDLAGALDRSERAVLIARDLPPSVALSLDAVLTAAVARASALTAAGRPPDAIGVLAPAVRVARAAPVGTVPPDLLERARRALGALTDAPLGGR